MSKPTAHSSRRARLAWLLAASLTAASVVYATRPRPQTPPPGMVYTAEGFGGYAPATNRKPAPATDFDRMRAAYDAGRFAEAERFGEAILRDEAVASTDPKARYRTLKARCTLAYAAARRKDFSLARERFADLRERAERLPDRGAQEPVLGEAVPTFADEAAFQETVCTGVLEGKTAADAGFRAFLRERPQSVLIHAAIKRIARLHDGEPPKEAEALWARAMRLQRKAEEAQQRAESLCGPACLAEALRRQGRTVPVETLAKAAGTDHDGTRLSGLAAEARRRGFAGRGVELTWAGLQTQRLPLIALIAPGHFVLVERVEADRVTVWDANAQGVGKAGIRTFPQAEWRQTWQGIALTL